MGVAGAEGELARCMGCTRHARRFATQANAVDHLQRGFMQEEGEVHAVGHVQQRAHAAPGVAVELERRTILLPVNPPKPPDPPTRSPRG
eukprot:8157132-Alexandrium_andersonii.AAC.1